MSRGLLTTIFQQYNKPEYLPQVYHESVAKILEHVTLVADEAMLQTIIQSGVLELKTESAKQLEILDDYIWALSNATFAASPKQLDYLICTCVRDLINALLRQNPLDKELKIAVLEGLLNLLKQKPEVATLLGQEVKTIFHTLSTEAGEPKVMALAAQLADWANQHN